MTSTAPPPPSPPSPPPNPARKSSVSSFLWSHLFSSDSILNSASKSSTTLPDGTPLILAPSDVLLNASAAWSGYLLCQFFGDTPSPAKIFSDLNPIWGRHGKISVKSFSEGTCLIHVPSPRTRQWVLDSCLWSAGTVSFAVSEWSASPSLINQSLTTVPVWLTIRELPPQLWSEAGATLIAQRLGTVVPSSRVILPPDALGTAKIRIILRLTDHRPPSAVVQDSEGNQVRISLDFGRLPPLCPSCKSYGHLTHRCPSRRRLPPSQNTQQPSSTQDLKSVQSDGVQNNVSKPNVSTSFCGLQDSSEPNSALEAQTQTGPLKPTSQHLKHSSIGPHNLPLQPQSFFHSRSSSRMPLSSVSPRRRSRPRRRRSTSPTSPPTVELATYRSRSPTFLSSRNLPEISVDNLSTKSFSNVTDDSPTPVLPPTTNSPPPGSKNNTNHSSSHPPVQDNPSFITQIQNDIKEALATPRPLLNTHTYFSTPSTSNEAHPSLHSPPSVKPVLKREESTKNSFRDFYNEVINSIQDHQIPQVHLPIGDSKEKGDKNKKKKSLSAIDFEADKKTIGALDST